MKVTIKYGRTFNLGDYQTERIDLEIEYGVPLEVQASDTALNTFLDQKFKAIQNKVMAWYDDMTKEVSKHG